MTTNLTALRDLCSGAVREDITEQAEFEAESEAEIVKSAGAFAGQRLGADTASVLGEWQPVDPAGSPDDTRQAAVQIAPRAQLMYSVNDDGDATLTLLTWCTRCHHHREARVNNLLSLAAAMQRAGLL